MHYSKDKTKMAPVMYPYILQTFEESFGQIYLRYFDFHLSRVRTRMPAAELDQILILEVRKDKQHLLAFLATDDVVAEMELSLHFGHRNLVF